MGSHPLILGKTRCRMFTIKAPIGGPNFFFFFFFFLSLLVPDFRCHE